MDEPSTYRISVKAIVVEDDRFLLTLEDNGMWEFLGGGIDYEEDPIACLKREVHEESGLTITKISPTPKYFVTFKRWKIDKQGANVIYEVKLKDYSFIPSDECQELRFFTIEEARKEKLHHNVEQFLKVFDPKLHNN